MDKKIVRSILDAAGDNNVQLIMDNMLIYNTKIQGHIVDFNDDTETVTILRVNDHITTMFTAPFELHVSAYEHIQFMTICAPYADMNNAIDMLKEYIPNKMDEMKEFLKTSSANKTYMATPSTENVTSRLGMKSTVYDTNNYGSAGENRRNKNPLEPIKTIKVNADGTTDNAKK